MSRLETLRQRRFPREFRIDAPVWPDNLAARLRELTITQLTPANQQRPSAAPISLGLLADACTGLWRLRQRMLQPGTDRPLEEMRRAYRHLESTWDTLAEAGVEIIDHTGTPFDIGLALKVIAYQPTPEISSDCVLETIKPTIYFQRERLQMGEVIVATPQPPT
jgi:hypothetical protein